MKYLLLFIPLLLAGCSGVNYDEQTKLQIAELQKQAEISKIACNNLEVVNNKINNLKGYLGNKGATTPPTVGISNDSKPISRTKTNTACIVGDTINIEEGFAEDYVYEPDCGAFSDYGVKGCNIDYDGNFCLLNTDLDELNKLLNL